MMIILVQWVLLVVLLHLLLYHTTILLSTTVYLFQAQFLCLVFFPNSVVFYLCLLSPLILFIFSEFFSPFLLLPLFIIPLFPLSLANKFINTWNSDIVSRRIQESHLNFPPYSSKPLF